MRELTPEIKIKIKEEAVKRLTNNNALIPVDKIELIQYTEILENCWKRNEIVFDWEIN